MRQFNVNCGHCGVAIVRKATGKPRRYCSSRCYHRAYRNRCKGLPETFPPRVQRGSAGSGNICIKEKAGRPIYHVRFRVNGLRYSVHYGSDRTEAERVRDEVATQIAAGTWIPTVEPENVGNVRRKYGYVEAERKKYGLFFSITIKLQGVIYRVRLGRSTDGWTAELAEAERARIEEEIRAGVWTAPVSRRRDAAEYAKWTCAKIEGEIERAIEIYERRTQREALPHLQMLKELASTLRSDLAGVAS